MKERTNGEEFLYPEEKAYFLLERVRFGGEEVNIYANSRLAVLSISQDNTWQGISSPRIAELFLDHDLSQPTRIEYSNQERPRLKFRGDINSIIEQVPFMCYSLSEVLRQERGRFTFHAAGIEKDNQGILILGDKGAGKTTLALDLCLRHGYSIIGNDVVIIGNHTDTGKIGFFGGDGVFKVRQLAANTHYPLLQTFFKNHEKVPYDNKIVIHPEDIGVKTNFNFIEITKIVQISLIASPEKSFVVSSPPPLQLRLRMLENASRYIRNIATPILDTNLNYVCLLPSFDSDQLSKKRGETIEKLIKQGIMSISGSNLYEINDFLVGNE